MEITVFAEKLCELLFTLSEEMILTEDTLKRKRLKKILNEICTLIDECEYFGKEYQYKMVNKKTIHKHMIDECEYETILPLEHVQMVVHYHPYTNKRTIVVHIDRCP